MTKVQKTEYATRLTCEEARNALVKENNPITSFETVPIRSSLNRILHEDMLCPVNVPNHTNSAMDGYAIQFSEVINHEKTSYELKGSAFAGRPFGHPIAGNTAVKIMTGAAMPEGADTVIILEDAEEKNNQITFKGIAKKGQNVRLAGEDLKAGQVFLEAGRRLTASDIGLIASVGISEVRVRRKVKVAFFSTGDELKSLGESLNVGEIYDSNRYTLYGLLKDFGAEIQDLGVVKDNPSELRKTLLGASKNNDAVITSGGVSVGEADHIKSVLASIGKINFWKILMKPGRPLAFGKIGESSFFGLPGNPVSVMITFMQFVQPALSKIAGETRRSPIEITARSTYRIRKSPGRTEFQRGILSFDENGNAIVSPLTAQGSGILSSMTEANALIHLPEECGEIEVGAMVRVQPFSLRV